MIDTEKTFLEMTSSYENSRSKDMTSKYWTELNRKNIDQLQREGYCNFKQTVGKNYFIWATRIRDPKIRYLMNNLPLSCVSSAFAKALFSKRHIYFSLKGTIVYNFLSLLLWEYTIRKISFNMVDSIEEPLEGNPPCVRVGRRMISQDLAYSVLELNEMIKGGVDFNSINTVMELGAGYGRTAYVFLKAFPHLKYIVADIPPALYISQRYLSGQLPHRKIFEFKNFKDYSEIADEFEESQIAFVLPSQLELLPTKTVDMFLAIDSLHEMLPKHIEYYFNNIDRLTKKFFYFKCWKITEMLYDDIVLKETDYPVRENWYRVFWNECDVLTSYFEALFRIDNGGN